MRLLTVLVLFVAMLSRRYTVGLRMGVTGIGRATKRLLSSSMPTSPVTLTTPQLYTSTSFFHFVDIADEIMDDLIASTKAKLEQAGAKGTVLLSNEGYNAQLAVPTPALSTLAENLKAVHSKIYQDVDVNIGQTIDYSLPDSPPFPFKKLVVRKKKAILTDGLNEPLNWKEPGPEMPAERWHEQVLQAGKEEPAPLVLDCRNKYESEMGTFTGAVPLNTTNFSETWLVLEELLKDTPRDAPILTYCTGGIRCVKVNAYLQQRLGFTNTHRLQGGIVAYERWLRESGENGEQGLVAEDYHGETTVEEANHGAVSMNIYPARSQDAVTEENRESGRAAKRSAFVGVNFVFDRRRLSRARNMIREIQE